jgi:hypothetical protein
MNASLSTVAVMSEAMVVSMSIIRTSEIAVDVHPGAPGPDQPTFKFWTYN